MVADTPLVGVVVGVGVSLLLLSGDVVGVLPGTSVTVARCSPAPGTTSPPPVPPSGAESDQDRGGPAADDDGEHHREHAPPRLARSRTFAPALAHEELSDRYLVVHPDRPSREAFRPTSWPYYYRTRPPNG